jgi:hypothetical protein
MAIGPPGGLAGFHVEHERTVSLANLPVGSTQGFLPAGLFGTVR